ncbi:MAG: universal stress protein [Methanomassiliicoccus sp.]|nr:universal stress protein [Methanomassiliicoccus sp.]
MRNILLPTDGSTPALVATMKAVEMAKARDATLIILKVEEQAPLVEIERTAEASALMRPEVQDGISYAQELAAMEKVTTKVVRKIGPVVGEIIRTAEEEGSELIVLGTSSLRGLNRLYLGSVAKAVVSQAPTSVVVIKPTPEEIKRALSLVKEVIEETPAKAVRSITRTKVFRVGVYLFVAYAIGYAIFILTGSYDKQLFGSALWGMNVGTVAGILLILITIGLAIGFNWYAGRSKEAT